jgi:hypothetical protein
MVGELVIATGIAGSVAGAVTSVAILTLVMWAGRQDPCPGTHAG